MSGIPRMRTIQQCASYLKENDPDCCVGEWCIRKMVQQRKIPVVRSGKKILVNLDVLLAYLGGTAEELIEEVEQAHETQA